MNDEPTDIRGRIYWDGMTFNKGIDRNVNDGYYIELTGISPESLRNLYDTCPAMRAAFADIIESAVQEQISLMEETAMEARYARYDHDR